MERFLVTRGIAAYLADTYDLLGAADAGGRTRPNDALPKAMAAASKAIQLDDSLAEPHVSLAHARYHYDHDWSGAEREFKRAIELNANYPLAHHWYALHLMCAGRASESLIEIKKAQKLDPLSMPINQALGWLLCDAGSVDEGIEQVQKTVEMDPGFMLAHHRLAYCYERKGMYQLAIAEYQKISNTGNPIAVAGLGQAQAMAGNRSEALKALARLQELSKEKYVATSWFALIYTAVGDKDQAFAWLNKAADDHDVIIARLKVDVRFDRLRSDSRFTELARKIRLPQ